MRGPALLSLIAMLAGFAAWGQTAQPAATPDMAATFGTRTSTPAPKAEAPVGLGGALQMVAALTVVALGIKFVLPRWMGSLSKVRIGANHDGAINVIETRAMPNGGLHLVEVKGRTFLLASTQNGTSLLADLTQPETKPVRITEPTTFEETLRAARPQTPVNDDEDPEMLKGDVHEALVRLKRITE